MTTPRPEKDKLAGIEAGAEANVQSDWNASSGVAEILNKPTLGTMAAEAASDYTKTSNLADVATSGDYDDLDNKPTIPAAQVNSDWDAASGVAEILNKPTPRHTRKVRTTHQRRQTICS